MGPYSIVDIHLGSSFYIGNQCNQPLLNMTHIFGLLFVMEYLHPQCERSCHICGVGFAIQGGLADDFQVSASEQQEL